jgi:hypothetical protein
VSRIYWQNQIDAKAVRAVSQELRMKLGRVMLSIASFASRRAGSCGNLAQPLAGAQHYAIESIGGRHGDSWVLTTADGTRMNREPQPAW